MSNVVDIRTKKPRGTGGGGSGVDPRNMVVIATIRDKTEHLTMVDISSRTARQVLWKRKFRGEQKNLDRERTLNVVAQRVQEMVHGSTVDNVRGILEGDRDGLGKRFVQAAWNDVKLEAQRRKANIVFDMNGWRVYNPTSGVWMVNVQNVGTVTLIMSPSMARINVRVVPPKEPGATFRAQTVVQGLRDGLAMLHTGQRIPHSPKWIDEVLTKSGITEFTSGVLPAAVHDRLQTIIQDLTAATHRGGEAGLTAKLREIVASLDNG